MNTYRVIFRKGGVGRRYRFDVDASHPATAVARALRGFSKPYTQDVDVSVRLVSSNVARHWSEPKVRDAAPA